MIVLLEKHEADPNTIISKLNIAPIHYAVGFENLEFAEKVTSIFLKKRGNPNLYSESDRLTPLHIACIWGRPTIVQLLLEHGGNLDLKCNEDQTAIQYAIHENQYGVIEVIQKFIFEQKIEKKKDLILKSRDPTIQESIYSPRKLLDESSNNPIKTNHLKNAIQSIDERKFTPNRINYNFDVTSPYYVNITHRRHKTSRELENSDCQLKDTMRNQKNLFELTENNLKQFSQQMNKVIVIDRIARTYINNWREKIQQVRRTNFKLDLSYVNYLNTCNNVTLMNGTSSKYTNDDSLKEDLNSSSDSFVTAVSDGQRIENAIEPVQESAIFIEHVEEDNIHSDTESGVIFYVKKITSKNRVNLDELLDETVDEDARSRSTTFSTAVTLPSLDYDTDALRREIVHITGEHPGPITKNTKKLYMKQLVKFKKRPENSKEKNNVEKCEFIECFVNIDNYITDSNILAYSFELQKTVRKYSHLKENINEYLKLEAQMVQHFLERSHIKWREGNLKTSFIYFLIDPRVSDNLPLQQKDMEKAEIWSRFLSSIFYVGKGKRSRPYSHLYDAIKLFSSENNEVAERLENLKNQIYGKRVIYSNINNKKAVLDNKRNKISHNLSQNLFQENQKLNRIIEIWKAHMGVVCLHIFNNIMPCEAYTREAAIIEAIGINNLTNMKRGEYYGITKNLQMRFRRQMGIGLLHRAMYIYLAEGESQLMPFDLI